MMWGVSEGMGWWMLFGGIFWIIVLAVLIWMVARLFEGGERHHEGTTLRVQGPETPLEIARRRYAAGEISEEEFRRIRDNLSGS